MLNEMSEMIWALGVVGADSAFKCQTARADQLAQDCEKGKSKYDTKSSEASSGRGLYS
jgi:hypothetical protein